MSLTTGVSVGSGVVAVIAHTVWINPALGRDREPALANTRSAQDAVSFAKLFDIVAEQACRSHSLPAAAHRQGAGVGTLWTWVGGSNSPNQPSVFGVLGSPATSNIPGARTGAMGWTDGTGSLWLFGGGGIDSTGNTQYLNDYWKFSRGQWTWMGGSQTGAASGVYGTQGMPASSNAPGAREFAVTWTDATGNLWLFGGYGYDANGALGDLNDLWRYNAGRWTWVAGSNLVNQPGVYGVLGSPAPANGPGVGERRWGGATLPGAFGCLAGALDSRCRC
jgi:hypothetical protein